jgi:hypothetical protein
VLHLISQIRTETSQNVIAKIKVGEAISGDDDDEDGLQDPIHVK